MIRKIFSISAILMLISTFLIADIGYALEADQTTKAKTEEVGKKLPPKPGEPRKGSIYDGSSFLIKNGNYRGNETTKTKFRQESGVNPATGKPYSASTIGREVTSMLKVGLLELDKKGNLRVPSGINRDVLDTINPLVQKIVTTKEPGKDKPLGLDRYNLADLPLDKLDAIAKIVSENLLTANQKVNIVAFPASFAENYGEVMLNIIDDLRADQIPVIVAEPGQELKLTDAIQDRISAGAISVVEVEPGSKADSQFADMFINQNFVGLTGTIDGLKVAIEQGAVAK